MTSGMKSVASGSPLFARLMAQRSARQRAVEAVPDIESGGITSGSSGEAQLIQREILFEDLRPTSDDYIALTGEIRLAGRFAAAGLIAQGLRLVRLKENGAYKDYYPSFERYCRLEHGMSSTYAYRLIRMAQMAERLSCKDQYEINPFEVLLALGHRHLLVLLPLESEQVEDLLVNGISLAGGSASDSERIPLGRATAKQLKQALCKNVPDAERQPARPEQVRNFTSAQKLVESFSNLVETLEDWSAWLGGDLPPVLISAREQQKGQLLELASRFRAASQALTDALATDNLAFEDQPICMVPDPVHHS